MELKVKLLLEIQRYLVAQVDKGIVIGLDEAHKVFQDGNAYEFLNLNEKVDESLDQNKLSQLFNNWFQNFTINYHPSKFGINNNGINWAIVLLSRWIEDLNENYTISS